MSDTARVESLTRSDAQARRAAQEVFDRPLLLEAGAGTGKTTSLVARVVAWSMGPGWSRAAAVLADAASASGRPVTSDRIAARVLGRVVAITFTEAAAAEMSARISEALRMLERADTPLGLLEDGLPVDPAERELRARALHGALDHLVVQTIHAYCRRLLAAHPLEARIHPHLEVDADRRVQAEVVRDVLGARIVDADAAAPRNRALVALTVRGDGPTRLEAQLLECIASGLHAQQLAADPFSAQRVAALGQRVVSAIDALFASGGDALQSVKSGSRTAQVVSCIDAIRTRFDACGERMADPAQARGGLCEVIEAAREHFGDAERKRLRDWARGKFLAGEEQALGESADRLATAAGVLAPLFDHVAQLDVEALDLARPLFAELLEEVQGELRSRGVATFEALLSGARDLLCQQPDVARRIRTGIDQLLVDEFQDTDSGQCDIVRALALSGPPEERPGLLLVGDPKQSIYGWRSADLAAYDAFAESVLADGGLRERLSVNYRSVPAILDEVERAIQPVMREARGLQPAFQPLVPSSANASRQGFDAGGRGAVEYWVSASWDAEAGCFDRLPAGAAAQLEARALARDLRDLHDAHHVAWSEVGVLFRSRTDWEIYLSALRDAGIPYAVEGDRNYYQRREVIDAAALVRCVLDSNDHVALITWLRGTAVGVPDAALIPLWTRGFPARVGALYGSPAEQLAALAEDVREIAAGVPDDVPGIDRIAGWHHNLIAALGVLAQLRAAFAEAPGDRFVELLRTLTLFEAGEAARYLGAWRGANLERFFRELAADLGDGGDAAAVLRRLRFAIASQDQAPEARPDEIVDDAVSIMTVHGAKGLDFDHVYLVQLHKGADVGTSRGACAGRGVNGGEYQLLGAATPGFDEVAAATRAVAEAERVRLLYVAMTRAKQRLVLAGLWPAFQQHRSAGQALELLASRTQSVPPLPQWMQELAAQQLDRGVDDAGVTWVFPGLQVGTRSDAGEARRFDAVIPTATQIRGAATQLAAARLEADARMRRPISSRASDAGREAAAESRAERRAGREAELPEAQLVGSVAESRGAAAASKGLAAAALELQDAPEAAAIARNLGTAVHRVLELCDFSLPTDALLTAAVPVLQASLSEELEGSRFEAALAAGRQLLDQIARGPLLERLRDLDGHIVARELSVLLPPEATAGGHASEDPVGFVAGAIDLVYRDPDSGELVVADYKTDRLADAVALDPDAVALRAIAEKYAGQGDVYRRGLRDALDLPYTPRFELWLLAHDRTLEVDTAVG